MNCSNCGSELTEGAKFCRECGTPVSMKTEALEENVCPDCGNILDENAIYCNNCGLKVADDKLVPEKKSEYCPKCNSLLEDEALFCGVCGTSLKNESLQQNVKTQKIIQESTQLNTTKERLQETQEGTDKSLIFLIVLLIVVLIGCGCVVGYVYYQHNSVNLETPDISLDVMTEDADEEAEDINSLLNVQNEQSTTPGGASIYLFPSDRQYITEADLEGKSKEDVALIRNEIYARRGHIFTTEPFKSYFEGKSWYVPNENFNDSMFSEIEKTNKDFLVAYEEGKGWR